MSPRRLIPAHAGKTGRISEAPPPPRAHPRSRGENAWAARRIAPLSGSSPLTRGKRVVGPPWCGLAGLIPAHAGKTPAKLASAIEGGAHPRSRGENVKVSVCFVSSSGSSPLTRGKPRMRHRATPDRGLIPAHAGKTTTGTTCRSGLHGSSPLTRGKRRLPAPVRRRPGLIPAHAGKTARVGIPTH